MAEQGRGPGRDRKQQEWRRAIGVLTAVVGLTALLSLYQNCAAPSSVAPSSESSTDDGLSSINHPMVEISSLQSEGDGSATQGKQMIACDRQAIRCVRKIYSPAVQDRHFTEQHCLAADGPCLSVDTFTYDTRAALAACPDCGPDAGQGGGRYNREESTCWYGEPGSAEAPIYSLRENLEAAIEAVAQACEGRGQ